MKKNKSLRKNICSLFLILCACLIINSCSKGSSTANKPNDTTTKTSTALLSKWSSVEPNGGSPINTTITYIYDSNKRLTTISGVGGDQDIFTGEANFTYSTNSILLKSSLNYQEEVDTKFVMDNLGRITTASDSKGNSESFTYSSDGYVATSKYYISTELDKSFAYNYSNGNMVSMIETDYDGITQQPVNTVTTNYTYYTDKPAINKVDFAINAILVGKVDYFPIEYSSDLLGKQSKNLLNSSVGNFTLTYVFSNNVPVQFVLDNNDATVSLSY
jgi:hypothetical protein